MVERRVRAHTDREFEGELQELRNGLLLMAGRVEQMISDIAARLRQSVTRDHFRYDHSGAEPIREFTERQIGNTRHRRQEDGVRRLHGPDGNATLAGKFTRVAHKLCSFFPCHYVVQNRGVRPISQVRSNAVTIAAGWSLGYAPFSGGLLRAASD